MADTLLARRRPPDLRIPAESALPTASLQGPNIKGGHNSRRDSRSPESYGASPIASCDISRCVGQDSPLLSSSPSRRQFLVPLGASARSLPDVFTHETCAEGVTVNQSSPIPIPSSGFKLSTGDLNDKQSRASASSRRLPDVFVEELETVRILSPGKPAAYFPLSPNVDGSSSQVSSGRGMGGRWKPSPRSLALCDTNKCGGSMRGERELSMGRSPAATSSGSIAVESDGPASRTNTPEAGESSYRDFTLTDCDVLGASPPTPAASPTGWSICRDCTRHCSREARNADSDTKLCVNKLSPKELLDPQRISAFYPSPQGSSPTAKRGGLSKSCSSGLRIKNSFPGNCCPGSKVRFDPQSPDLSACCNEGANNHNPRAGEDGYSGLDVSDDYVLPSPDHVPSMCSPNKQYSPKKEEVTEFRSGLVYGSFSRTVGTGTYSSGRELPVSHPAQVSKTSKSSMDIILPSILAAKNYSTRKLRQQVSGEEENCDWQQRPARRSAGTEVAQLAQSLREDFRRSIQRADGNSAHFFSSSSRALEQELEFARSHPESFRV
mmetsp:Transcript_37153/g.66498  ORF Transcript_37153/g.66498 Transcript_37153/m.66498 type:complete len:551 (-) Transcript_37153:139-1791(-)